MPLAACRSDITEAADLVRQYSRDYTAILNGRVKPEGLPAYIQPPKNAQRWQPGKNTPLVMPAVPAGVDQLVFEERVPLGYDGIITALTNMWNGTGFVEGSGDITWRVKIDQRFIPFFEAITTTLGDLTTPFDVQGQGIQIYSGQNVQYYANFAAGSAARLAPATGATVCAVTGNIWPRERPQAL